MTWTVTIGGSIYPIAFDKVEQELNGWEKGYFAVDNSEAMVNLLDSVPTVTIKFLGVTILSGKAGAYQFVTERTIKVQVYDTVYYLMENKVHPDGAGATKTVTYSATQCNTILTAVAGDVAGVSAGSCPTDAITVKFNRANTYKIVKFLARSVNKDYYSSGGDTINIGTRGSNKGRLEILGNPSRRKVSNFKNKTKVIVRGTDVNGADIEGSAGAGTDVKVYTEKKANDITTLNNIAQSYLDELNASSNGVKLQSPIESSFGLNPGDTVTVNRKGYNLSGSYKIWRITKYSTYSDIEIDRAEAVLEKYLDEQKSMEDFGIFTSTEAILDNPVGNPADISGVAVANNIDTLKVTWTRCSDADFDKYIVFRKTSAGATSEVARVGSNVYVDEDVAYGTTYYYRVKAVDRVGNESSNYSNEDNGTPDKIATGDISDGAVTAVKGVLALMGWSHDMIFSATDHNTVAWTNNDLKLSSGTYTIDAGNTGDISATTYIVFDTDISTTVLQAITDVANTVGNNRLLIGVCSNVASGKFAKFQIFGGGWGGTFIGADEIAAGIITANELLANFIITNSFMTQADVGVSAAGVLINSSGLFGYDTTPTMTFSLDAATGLLTVGGTETMRFYDTIGGNLRGWIGGGSFGGNDVFHIRSQGVSLYLDVNGDIVSFTQGGDIVFDDDFDALTPASFGSVDLGTPSLPFRYIIPTTVIGSRPTADSTTVGMPWNTRAGTGQKTIAWICVENDNADGNYEWIQTGIST